MAHLVRCQESRSLAFLKAILVKDLNWRTLEQRRIDSRLTLMYTINYDLVAISAADYLIPNTRQ